MVCKFSQLGRWVVTLQASDHPVLMVGCTPSPTHPDPQHARNAPFGGRPTGLFRGFLREVSWKMATLRPIRKRAILQGEKPACLEPVSFEDRLLPQGLVHGQGFTLPTIIIRHPMISSGDLHSLNRIRPCYAPGCTTFPDPEGIILRNEGINPAVH